MKQILSLIVFFGMSSAFATQKQCDVTATTNGVASKTVEVLQAEVKPGTDLAAYVMEKTINGFDVYVVEVDGNYFANIKVAGAKVHAQAVNEVTLSASYKNKSIELYCY